jgi:hypothetical protein
VRTRIVLTAALTAALALPSFAQASLPHAHSTSIVPFKSLAGLKLNSSVAAATKAWGKGGTCTESSCTYTSKTGGTASFLAARKLTDTAPLLVVQISIEAPLKSSTSLKRNFNTPLASYRTPSGIGIGSSAKSLKHAYPHLIKEGTTEYILKGPGESSATFVLSEGKVEAISTASAHLG